MTTAVVRGSASIPVLVLVCLLAACRTDRRPLRTGYTDLGPFVRVAPDGGPSGMAVEAVNEAARRGGIRVEWVATPDGIEPALDSGRIDAIPLATVTPERERRWTFTAPWWTNEMALVSRQAHPIGPRNLAGARVGIRNQSFNRSLTRRLLPGAELVPMGNVAHLFRDVCSAGIDALFLDVRRIHQELLTVPGICPVPLAMQPVPGGLLPMATASRTPDGRVAALSRQLENMSVDGTLARIASNWGLSAQDNEAIRQALMEQKRQSGLHWAGICLLTVLGLGTWQMRRVHRSETRAREALAEAERARLRAEESEGRFESFMNHLPAMAIVKDDQGRAVYVNRMHERIFGVSPAKVLGKCAVELYPVDMAAQIQEDDNRVRREGKAIQVVERMTGLRGSRYWLVFRFPMRGPDGRQFLGAMAVDISRQRQAERALRYARERFRVLFERAPVAYHELDAHGIVRQVNDAECRLFGFARSELIGRHASEMVDPVEQAVSRDAVARKLSGELPLAPYRRTYRRADGGQVRCEVHETLVRDGQRITGIHSALIDVTRREQAERLERDCMRVLEMITAGEPAGAVLKAIALLVHNHLGAACTIEAEPGANREPAPGVQVRQVVGRHGQNAAVIRVADRGEAAMAAVIPIAEGLVRVALDHSFLLNQLRFRAEHDALTGLPNRYVVERTLEKLVEAGNGSLTAILFIDLDGFKWVNDTYGHAMGDHLLAGVAGRLTGAVRRTDLVARVGGDEFIIVLHTLQREAEAAAVAEKILSELEHPFLIAGHEVFVSPSIGIACFPVHATDLAALMIKADQAMYQAKQAGKNRYVSASEG